MTANQKVTGRALSIPGGLMLGTSISLVITLLLSGILAKLVNSEKLAWEQIGYGIMALLFLSSTTGAITASSAIKRRKLAVCLSSGILYWVSLLAITALFFGGQYHGLGATAATIFCGCGVVYLLGLRREDVRKGRGRKKKYR